MKIALTGADGMLGQAIRRVFSQDDLIPLTRRQFDITDLDQAVSVLRGLKPDYLIHAAAFTNVDLCETERDKAVLVNSIGARNVTIACEEIGCTVMYVSSDYVFDGKKGTPYDEWDNPNPVNHYGVSKLLGEQFVSTLTSRFMIVRTSWLYGTGGKNFVDTIRSLLVKEESLRVVDDQVGSPTLTDDLAGTLKRLIGRGYGVYHASNTGSCSWHGFAVEIARLSGISKPVIPVSTKEFPRPARRPSYSVLNNTMLRLEGITGLRPWKDALEAYCSRTAT